MREARTGSRQRARAHNPPRQGRPSSQRRRRFATRSPITRFPVRTASWSTVWATSRLGARLHDSLQRRLADGCVDGSGAGCLIHSGTRPRDLGLPRRTAGLDRRTGVQEAKRASQGTRASVSSFGNRAAVAARQHFQALVPCVLASVPGVVWVTVIKEDVPHLLAVGLL